MYVWFQLNPTNILNRNFYTVIMVLSLLILTVFVLFFLGISHLYASHTSTNPGPMDPASFKNESNVSPRAISLTLSSSKVGFLICFYFNEFNLKHQTVDKESLPTLYKTIKNQSCSVFVIRTIVCSFVVVRFKKYKFMIIMVMHLAEFACHSSRGNKIWSKPNMVKNRNWQSADQLAKKAWLSAEEYWKSFPWYS